MGDDGRHLRVEIAVEQIDEVLRRQAVGERGEAAHVRQPDRRLDRFGIAAADAPVEDALAGVAPDIGFEQRAGGAAQREDLGHPRQRRHHRLDAGDVAVAEPARRARRPGRDMDRASGEDQRRHEIVGDAIGDEVVEHREIARARGIGQAPAQRLA